MKYLTKNLKSLLLPSMASLLLFGLAACGESSNNSGRNNVPQTQEDSTGPLGPESMQVERLGRPVINEGLIITNDLLNAFNSIPPSADLSEEAAPVLAEAAMVLDAFDQIDGKDDLTVGQVVTAFIPDVMRIDTRVDIAPGTAAYNADTSGDKGMLTGGRKIEDDVVDITLSFLVAGDASGESVSDGVSYAGASGNVAQPGHKYLHNQSGRGKNASFPFLAEPN